ncbi:Mitochondrial substrate carrier family protein E [Galdieria sulphuraria]|nr:Mitochondrial substrate carrier family protein E [Galdieria sulphuraria]
MEVLKQRVQVRSQQSNSFAALGDLLKYEGPKALFKGYFLTLGVFGPYSMIYFVCYEHFKSWGRKWNKQRVVQLLLPVPLPWTLLRRDTRLKAIFFIIMSIVIEIVGMPFVPYGVKKECAPFSKVLVREFYGLCLERQ